MKAQGLRICVWEYPYVSIHSTLFSRSWRRSDIC